jgi:hypothetical protein
MPWFSNSFLFVFLDSTICCQDSQSGWFSPDWAGVIVALLALFATIWSTAWQINESKKAAKARNEEAEKLQKQRDKESRETESRRILDLERLERQRADDQLKVAEARRLNIRADWFKNQIYIPNKTAFDNYFFDVNIFVQEIEQIHKNPGAAFELEVRIKNATKLFLDILIDTLGPFDPEFYQAVRNRIQGLESEILLSLYERLEPSANQEISMPANLFDSCRDLKLLLLRWVYNYRGDFKMDFPSNHPTR